ncbi:MAG TPA: acyl-CoA ligase (AMP-forming), exosortase A system-associated [Arenibaculum sp.]|nr:acyl-CoA ligase (AMP-forming), exosortase A system-associated [Arenibaculum sp.]
MTDLLHDLVYRAADTHPEAVALTAGKATLTYGELAETVSTLATGLHRLGLAPADRIAVFLEKRFETVAATFAAAGAGCAFVPINPLLKPNQVGHILRDCSVRVLVTSPTRLNALGEALNACHDLRAVALVDEEGEPPSLPAGPVTCSWQDLLDAGRGRPRQAHRRIDADIAAIFYTSGSTGLPKGVVLSHRNLVVGARSVAGYLGNHAGDRLLAVLPLSFDAGFSQLTTAFSAGAGVVLLNYLMPRDVVAALAEHRITGLTGVPPLFIQIAGEPWPPEAAGHLRYVANTGGAMPAPTLARLRARLPKTRVFLMYGLTEAFRSTYLPPEELDRRPGSIGKAIPNAEILVVKPDGTPCGPGEEGELVHRGPLVSLGYWNAPERTAERFRPAPNQPPGLTMPEPAVWSGDIVTRDEDGFLYFVGRRDEMIKTSGNRVSPTEIEDVLHATGLIAEAVAVGSPHPTLGQGIVVLAVPRAGTILDKAALLAECRRRLANFMVPHAVIERTALPRNPNGKIDRSRLRGEVGDVFAQVRP